MPDVTVLSKIILKKTKTKKIGFYFITRQNTAYSQLNGEAHSAGEGGQSKQYSKKDPPDEGWAPLLSDMF